MPAEQCAKRAEWRSHGLGQDIAEHLPDDAADAELRVVERAFDRQIQVDLAAPVGQQREREPDWQLGRLRAVDRLSERQLVEIQVVDRLELAVFDEVRDIHRQLAFLDAVAGVLG